MKRERKGESEKKRAARGKAGTSGEVEKPKSTKRYDAPPEERRVVSEPFDAPPYVTPHAHHKVGPNIVRVWFDTVINPLLDAMKVENEYASERNWTWRFRQERFEVLRPAEAHVGSLMRDNLDQVLQLNPSIAAAVGAHEDALLDLGKACGELQRVIASSAEMRAIYGQATAPGSLDRLGVTLQSLFGGYDEEENLCILTQYTINRIESLPDYYTIYKLWNAWSGQFLGVLDAPGIRGYTARMDEAGDAVAIAIQRSIAVLAEHRLQLSLQHDVPYKLPPPGETERGGWGRNQ